MDATCVLRGEQIVVEAFYIEFRDDLSPAQNAKVRVENDSKQVVAEGRTDERGVWTFAKPAPGRYRLFIHDVSHTAEKFFSISEDGKELTVHESNFFDPDRDSRPIPTTKDEANRFPYIRVGLGLGIITLLAGLIWLMLHRRKEPGTEPPQ